MVNGRFIIRLMIFASLLLIGLTGTAVSGATFDKLSLWNSGTTLLRGANIFQRIHYLAVDGPDFLGSGHVGPPYTQSDFDQLAAMGANYVNLSIPGIYTISPPYVLDTQAEANLDNLLTMAANADLFAVISFRTGPGRSDFTFYRDGAGVWFDPSYLIETVWTQQAAQDAWVRMWHDTAARYKNNPIVVGYDLMVEPNSNAIVNPPEYDPQTFFNTYGNTLYNWNNLAPRLVTAVRSVDTDTPILLSGNSWGSLYWLDYTPLNADPRIVYTAHNYEPGVYAQQDYSASMNTYPGTFDADGDGNDDTVNQSWQENWYTSTLDAFLASHDVPFAVNEFGVTRWSPGAETYLADEFSILEARGLNHAIWMYHANWQPFKDGDNSFDFTLGSDPNNTHNVASSALLTAIRQDWSQNTLRPSNFSAADAAPARNYFAASPVTLTWNPVSGATAYQVQIASNNTFTIGAAIYPAGNALSLSPLTLPKGTYFWRVQAQQPDGVHWGSWSTPDSFVVAS